MTKTSIEALVATMVTMVMSITMPVVTAVEARCPEQGLRYQITAGLQAEDSSLSLTLMR